METVAPFRLEIFSDSLTGKCPFKDWINKLNDRIGKSVILVKIERLRLGNFGNTKSLGDGLFELKIDFGPGYRVYFGQKHEKLIVLIMGGDKGAQKDDIKKSKILWNEERKRKNEK